MLQISYFQSKANSWASNTQYPTNKHHNILPWSIYSHSYFSPSLISHHQNLLPHPHPQLMTLLRKLSHENFQTVTTMFTCFLAHALPSTCYQMNHPCFFLKSILPLVQICSMAYFRTLQQASYISPTSLTFCFLLVQSYK